MTLPYKQTILDPNARWVGLLGTLLMSLGLLGYFNLPGIRLSLSVAESRPLRQEVAPSFSLSFSQTQSIESLLETQPLEAPAPISQEPTHSEADSNSQDKGEAEAASDPETLQRLAHDLNHSFNRVKYYSLASRNQGLEGEVTLFVTLNASSQIEEIRAEHSLPQRLERDLETSLRKLERAWRGSYDLPTSVTVRMQVVYRLL